LLAPHLVWATVASLRLAGRHAVRSGARGDAVVEARLFGPHMLLGYDYNGITETYRSPFQIREARTRLTLPLASLAGEPQALLGASRLALNEIFNAFGQAENPYIAAEGVIRTRYFPEGYQVGQWAEKRGLPTTAEAAPE